MNPASSRSPRKDTYPIDEPAPSDESRTTHLDQQSYAPANKIQSSTHLGITIRWADRRNGTAVANPLKPTRSDAAVDGRLKAARPRGLPVRRCAAGCPGPVPELGTAALTVKGRNHLGALRAAALAKIVSLRPLTVSLRGGARRRDRAAATAPPPATRDQTSRHPGRACTEGAQR